jgi:hypothetical protein
MTMFLFWFLLPLIIISAIKRARKPIDSWQFPEDLIAEELK